MAVGALLAYRGALRRWLRENPALDNLPQGWGVWGDLIFADLYRHAAAAAAERIAPHRATGSRKISGRRAAAMPDRMVILDAQDRGSNGAIRSRRGAFWSPTASATAARASPTWCGSRNSSSI